MYEVEIRGKLNKAEFAKLKDFLDQNARFEESYKRLSVEMMSTFTPENRAWSKSDINFRVKKSDDSEKISLKLGSFDALQMEEHEVHLQSGQFLAALNLLAKLGHDKGLIYYWESWVYEYHDMEVKISQYTDDYFFWEIEYRGEGSEAESEAAVFALAQELALTPLPSEEYRAEIEYQNVHIFEIYTPENINRIFQEKFSN